MVAASVKRSKIPLTTFPKRSPASIFSPSAASLRRVKPRLKGIRLSKTTCFIVACVTDLPQFFLIGRQRLFRGWDIRFLSHFPPLYKHQIIALTLFHIRLIRSGYFSDTFLYWRLPSLHTHDFLFQQNTLLCMNGLKAFFQISELRPQRFPCSHR